MNEWMRIKSENIKRDLFAYIFLFCFASYFCSNSVRCVCVCMLFVNVLYKLGRHAEMKFQISAIWWFVELIRLWDLDRLLLYWPHLSQSLHINAAYEFAFPAVEIHFHWWLTSAGRFGWLILCFDAIERSYSLCSNKMNTNKTIKIIQTINLNSGRVWLIATTACARPVNESNSLMADKWQWKQQ